MEANLALLLPIVITGMWRRGIESRIHEVKDARFHVKIQKAWSDGRSKSKHDQKCFCKSGLELLRLWTRMSIAGNHHLHFDLISHLSVKHEFDIMSEFSQACF